jgi:hypothetical protein
MQTRAWAADNLAARLLERPWSSETVGATVDAALGRLHHRTRFALKTRLRAFAGRASPPSPQALKSFLIACEFFRPDLSAPFGAALEPPAFAPAPGLGHLRTPALATLKDLADWLGLSPGELDWFAGERGGQALAQRRPLQHYRYALSPKASGGVRLLEAPKPRLKAVQRRILVGILRDVPVHPCVHGFVVGRSCLTGAGVHAAEAVVAAFDLAHFFPTISRPRVEGMFRSLGYPFAVAHRLAGLCTVETPRAVLADLTRGPAGSDQRALLRSPHLPQGAPTSPALANLLAFRLDVRLSALARAAQGAYTRYADDLFFSGGDTFAGGLPRFGAAVGRIAAEEGFRLNPGKTRIMRRYQRQSVTGIVVNDHCNAPRAEFERLKAILHNCLQNGPAGQDKEGGRDFRRRLEGRIAWVEQINPHRAQNLRGLFERIDWAAGPA